jgi:hypothetical protein
VEAEADASRIEPWDEYATMVLGRNPVPGLLLVAQRTALVASAREGMTSFLSIHGTQHEASIPHHVQSKMAQAQSGSPKLPLLTYHHHRETTVTDNDK